MLGTILGVLLIGVINNGLTLNNVEPFWVQFIQGGVIFLAVLFDLAQPAPPRRLSGGAGRRSLRGGDPPADARPASPPPDLPGSRRPI